MKLIGDAFVIGGLMALVVLVLLLMVLGGGAGAFWAYEWMAGIGVWWPVSISASIAIVAAPIFIIVVFFSEIEDAREEREEGDGK